MNAIVCTACIGKPQIGACTDCGKMRVLRTLYRYRSTYHTVSLGEDPNISVQTHIPEKFHEYERVIFRSGNPSDCLRAVYRCGTRCGTTVCTPDTVYILFVGRAFPSCMGNPSILLTSYVHKHQTEHRCVPDTLVAYSINLFSERPGRGHLVLVLKEFTSWGDEKQMASPSLPHGGSHTRKPADYEI